MDEPRNPKIKLKLHACISWLKILIHINYFKCLLISQFRFKYPASNYLIRHSIFFLLRTPQFMYLIFHFYFYF